MLRLVLGPVNVRAAVLGRREHEYRTLIERTSSTMQTGMYTVTVEADFCATHRVRLPDGSLEPLHGHDWRVRAMFTRPALDDHAMVIDFEHARQALQQVLAELHHADLNTHPALNSCNPTAEVVARYIFDALRARGLTALHRVEVTEAPGCTAAFSAS